MLIADIPLPKNLKIPDIVREGANCPIIEVHTGDVPFEGAVWISCCYAWPHVDLGWRGQVFLTVSVVSSHEAADALTPECRNAVPVGRLFVVDPTVRHWLTPIDSHVSTHTPPWVGLQWEVPRRKAKEKAREIVTTMGGHWLPNNDKRYADWKPE